MAKLRESRKWEEITIAVERKAVAMSDSTDQIPVPLCFFAKQQNVRAVRFERLISTGGIRQEDREYVIVISSRAAGAECATTKEILTDSPMWNEFGPPLRFTIAHELAHMLFYDLVPSGPNSALLAENPDKLECVCNRIAASLLLPRSRLPPDLKQRRFDVDYIGQIIARFKVSAEAFLWRFANDDVKGIYKDCDGIIGLLRHGRNGWSIKACLGRGVFTIPLLGNAKTDDVAKHLEGKGMEALRLPPAIEMSITSEGSGSCSVDFPWRDKVAPFALQWRRLYDYPHPRAVVFSLQTSGILQQRTTLFA